MFGMFLVLGLGNIGIKYEITRHNVGFMILDKFCEKFNITLNKTRSKYFYGISEISNRQVVFIKPTTYMNLSGDALVDAIKYFKINIDNILVIYDDISLDFLKIRIREKGSHGGHNGIRDIIDKINTSKFKRIRVGIGENKDISLSNYVLSNFTLDELRKLGNKYEDIFKCIEMIINEKILEAMNIFN